MMNFYTTLLRRYSVYKNCGSIESVNIESVFVYIQVVMCIFFYGVLNNVPLNSICIVKIIEIFAIKIVYKQKFKKIKLVLIHNVKCTK